MLIGVGDFWKMKMSGLCFLPIFLAFQYFILRLNLLNINLKHFQGVRVAGNYREIEELKRQRESRHENLLKARLDLEAAELELENLPPYEPPKDEFV